MRSRRPEIFVLTYLLLASGVSSSAQGQTRYNIIALDVLPGGLDSLAFGLNDQGQVVGASRLDRSGDIGQSRPVVWDYSGTPTELWNDPVGGSAADINNAGVVVGRMGTGFGMPTPGPGVPFGRGFVWDATNGRRALGLEPVGNTEAVAINDAGQVVGTSEVLTTIGDSTFFAPRAFIWDEINGIRDLGTLGGPSAFANDINATGQVVGQADLPSGSSRAFIWDETSGMQALPTIAGGRSGAVAINDLGQVLGGEEGAGTFILDPTTGFQLVPIGGIAFNNLGQVIGGAVGDPMIWDETNGVASLATLIPPNLQWTLEIAISINDAGDIVGYGLLNDQIRGFLMTPVPEPQSALLASIAILISMTFYRSYLYPK